MNFSSLPFIDFYVSVIDNYGDMGFAVNLALSLHKKYPNIRIRFFSDDSALFQKFFREGIPEWMEYRLLEELEKENPITPAKLIYNFFDRPLPKMYLAGFSYKKTIVSFSYFLLHRGLESLHGTTYTLESGYDRVIHFVPSLLHGGGGVIINPEIERRREEILKISRIEARSKFFEKISLKIQGDFGLGLKGQNNIYEKKWVSVFVYPETMQGILEKIQFTEKDVIFFLFLGDATKITEDHKNIIWIPFLSIEDYGVFQSLCDANIVRGENSLCQSLISGKPTLWDIYKELNGAHREKIEDYLAFLSKQFSETNWGKYGRIMRGFNEGDDKGGVFSDFVSGVTEYKEVFGEISEYVREECDLIRKLEEILEK